MDTLAADLAHEARQLNLSALNMAASSEEVVRSFAQVVLNELAARGLLDSEPTVGCWARPRSGSH